MSVKPEIFGNISHFLVNNDHNFFHYINKNILPTSGKNGALDLKNE